MVKLTHGTWVLIADGEKALFTENQTDGQDPFLQVIRQEEQDNPPNREQAASLPGRLSDGPGASRSAVQDTDWHQLAKDRFADDLADILYDYAHNDAFHRIVLVAPPGTLGELRDKMHSEVASRVIAEVPKTLTNHPLNEIEKIVSKDLAS